jgi:glucosyl-3-phosphoglycerate synthase
MEVTMIRCFEPIDDLSRLRIAKCGRRVSVVLPARNEEATVGAICDEIVQNLMGEHGLVDELLVLDDGSIDDTARVATAHGATVVSVASILPLIGEGEGKGNVLWKAVHRATGHIVVFCDADLTSFTWRYVARLVAPLLLDPDVSFVKSFYERKVDGAGDGGGRTTELMARPLFTLLHPEIAGFRQPLSGEFAARRRVLERIPFVEGYGVESAMLIDLHRMLGEEALVQVDLGVKSHRHRPLSELSVQAAEIAAVILQRAGMKLDVSTLTLLVGGTTPVPVRVRERPPLEQLQHA